MNGQKLTTLEQRLQALSNEIHQIQEDAQAEGKGLGANEAASMVTEVRGYALELKLRPILNRLNQIQRELVNFEAGLDGRERVAHHVPREFRFRTRQSIAGSRERQQSVYELLVEILAEIRSKFGNTAPSQREVLEAAVDAVQQGLERPEKLSTFAAQYQSVMAGAAGPEIHAATTTNASYQGLAVMAWLLLYMLMRGRRG